MLDNRTIAWIKLALIQAIGPVIGKKLLERFKEPERILDASKADIASVVGTSVTEHIFYQRNRIEFDKQVKLIEQYGVKVIGLADPLYPAALKNIFDPPFVLFIRGQMNALSAPSISVVGTRLASLYGITMARTISRQLVQYGFYVISGGARGIDTASHQAVLEIRGMTMAVLGCGVDVVYPVENRELFQRIVDHGALVSEFPMGTPPLRQHFPRRNRIISGLSLGVVVVEAPARSGAVITALSALEQGRDVFCVPGPADSFTMKGSHRLLKDGAKLVEDISDIVEELEARVNVIHNLYNKEMCA